MPSLPLLCCSYRIRARLPVHPGSECCCMTYHAAVMRYGGWEGGGACQTHVIAGTQRSRLLSEASFVSSGECIPRLQHVGRVLGLFSGGKVCISIIHQAVYLAVR